MPDSQVEEVKSKVDIVSIIGERVALKKSGRNLKGLCPFHGEKSPSFFVTPDMQIYKCFGCGASGDVFSFLMNYEGLTFPEALEMLAERAGVVLTKRERTTSELQRDRVLELMHLASEYYHYLLTEHKVGSKALQYLKDRGISNQSIKDFKLGYSLDSWDGLQQYLVKKKGYTLAEVEASGLIIKRGESNGFYDRFRSRIMFPLTTYAGKIVGFSGRTMDQDAKEAKYINSPETEYYHKSELLFGVSLAKKAIRENNRIIIMEGEFDVISSHQIGIKEAVAIKGSALTDEQASLIRRITHNVILALDADAAGQDAIHRGISVCEKQALNLRVVRITGGKDPDELAKSDPKAWKAAITGADSVYSYLIESACEQYNPESGEGKKQITQSVMPELIKIEHAVEREFYMKKLAEKLHVSDIALNEELQKTRRTTQLGTTTPPPVPTSYSRRELLERQLLGLILQSSNPTKLIAQIDIRWFSEPHLKRLAESMMTSDTKYRGAALVKQLPEATRPLAEDVFTMQVKWLEESEEAIQDLLAATTEQLSEMWNKQRMVELSRLMSAPDIDEADLHALQQEYRDLTNRDREGNGGRGNNKSV